MKVKIKKHRIVWENFILPKKSKRKIKKEERRVSKNDKKK